MQIEVCNKLLDDVYYSFRVALVCYPQVADIFRSPAGNVSLRGNNPGKVMKRSAFYFCFRIVDQQSSKGPVCMVGILHGPA